MIRKLYQIEEEARGFGHDERRVPRQKRAAPLLRELMRLARAMGPSVLPKSPLGEALTYLRNQMRYVAQYIRDGRLEIDNNGAYAASTSAAQSRSLTAGRVRSPTRHDRVRGIPAPSVSYGVSWWVGRTGSSLEA